MILNILAISILKLVKDYRIKKNIVNIENLKCCLDMKSQNQNAFNGRYLETGNDKEHT